MCIAEPLSPTADHLGGHQTQGLRLNTLETWQATKGKLQQQNDELLPSQSPCDCALIEFATLATSSSIAPCTSESCACVCTCWTRRSHVRVVFGTEGASSVSSVFTLCNSAIGAGVLSLPYAFQCAGEHNSCHSNHMTCKQRLNKLRSMLRQSLVAATRNQTRC